MLKYSDLESQLSELHCATQWYVGFSGGLDSTVLLHLLHEWCAANPDAPTLSAIHINHGMQSAADEWQDHCEETCRSLQLVLRTHSVEVHSTGTGESAARDGRYRAFAEQLEPDAVLFLGHHLDDQVETFFLRLMRGAGVEGLVAMPRVRSLGEGQLVRPLLDCSRVELEHYAAHHGLAHVEDPSNQNTDMDRNFLRTQVLPLLASRWPAYRQSVARASGHMAAAALVLGEVPETVHSAMGDAGLLLESLTIGSGEVAATKLRAWLRSQGCQAPDHALLTEFLRQLRTAAVDSNPRLACSTYVLQRYLDGVYLVPDFVAPAPAQSLDLVPEVRCEVPGAGTVNLQRSDGDGLILAPGEQLTVCWRQGGERCRLPGREQSQSLKNLLQEWRIPPWWRDRVPLIYFEDKLVAVGDLARCESTRWRAAAQKSEDLWTLSWERSVSASSD